MTRWILIVSGLLTSTMFYAAFAPRAALVSMFGTSLDGPVAEIVVRNWGALAGTIGLMLIWSAFDNPVRRLVLGVAIEMKLIYLALLGIYGQAFIGTATAVSIGVDIVMVIVFGVCLVRGCDD